MNTDTAPLLKATIHIGASSISMIVMEQADGEEPRVLDFLEKTVPLARDIFGAGAVSRATIELMVGIIRGFRHSLQELGGADMPVQAVATNILSEATNADAVLNRLRVACSLEIETLDDGEMTRLIYLKTRRRLQDTPSMKTATTLVLHVGPGNTRVLLFNDGHIVRYDSYRLGTHRTWEAIDSAGLSGEGLVQIISQHVASQVEQIYYDFRSDKVEEVVVIGQEMQLLSPHLKKEGEGGTKVKLKKIRKLTRRMSEISEAQRVRDYQLDFQTADGALPALIINQAIADIFGIDFLHVPESDYDRGLLLDLSCKSMLTEAFRDEVVRSAEYLASDYQASLDHGRHVARLCSDIVEQTRTLHSFNRRDELLLEVASLLHECGNYISGRQHEEHSMYIIENSEIFGLSNNDRMIVALVARYHRGRPPKLTDREYGELSTADRIRVSMLASILRVADALERAHCQRVKSLHIELQPRKAIFHLLGVSDGSTERLAMQSKGQLFEEIFGLTPVIQEAS